MPEPDRRQLRELLERLVAAHQAIGPTDSAAARRMRYQSLADSDDPVIAELGRQLLAGLHRPHQLLGNARYCEALQPGLDRLKQLDEEFDATEAQAHLAKLVDELEQGRRGGR